MALADDIKVLSQVRLFEPLGEEQLRLLAFGAETMKLPKGRELYKEGRKADCAYVVAQGAVDLFRMLRGQRQVVQTAGPGTMLGEIALIADTDRPTSAVAAEDSVVIRLNRTLFRRILEEYPEIAARLHDSIADALRDMIAKLSRLESRFSEPPVS
jgi:CRP-like cAMP-binding protein